MREPIKPAGTFRLLWENLRRTRRFEDDAWPRQPELPRSERLNLRRALPLRHLDCGSCHGCELSLLRLENPFFDMQQYNVRFEAAARVAFLLVATGPWTRNSVEAAQLNLDGMSVPAVVAFGDCAINGGPFAGSYAVAPRAEVIPDRYIVAEIPGCPPGPYTAEREFLALYAKWKAYCDAQTRT